MFRCPVIHLISACCLALALAACSSTNSARAGDGEELATPAAVPTAVTSLEADADRALLRGQWSDAARVYDLLEESGEASARTLIHRAACDLGQGDLDGARHRALEVLAQPALDQEHRRMAWNIAARAGGCSECLASPECSAAGPSDDPLVLVASICAIQAGELELASRLLDPRPTTAEGLTATGLLAWINDDTSAALLAFEQALEVSPDYLDALRNAGFVAHEMGRTEPALRYLERYLSLSGPASADRARVQATIETLRLQSPAQ